MSNMPALSPKEIIRILEKKGFVLDRSRGSHMIYFHPEVKKRVVVPVSKKSLPKGTFFAILKQAGIDKKDLTD